MSKRDGQIPQNTQSTAATPTVVNGSSPAASIPRFKFKEPKLRETTLDRSVRCMTLTVKRQNMLKEFLVDEIQSIDLCVDRICEIKRQLKIERQEFFRRPLTMARIKEKRKNDEHYDDFIKEYEEQENQLRDYEMVYFNLQKQKLKSGGNMSSTQNASTSAGIGAAAGSDNQGGSTGANQTQGANVQTSGQANGTRGEKEKGQSEKKKDKKSMMFGKLVQKDPIFRLYRQRTYQDEDENNGQMMVIEEEVETPSFKYKYLTKEQLLQQKLENQPKKHNIPEKYCKCCNQLVRRHYCPHDYCPKPCLRQEKEKRLRQQYLDKNGGVRKQKKPLYKASIFANDISMAKSAIDETWTLEQQQEAEKERIIKAQAYLSYMRENEQKIQQYKMSKKGEEFLPKKKGRKPKPKNPDGSAVPSNGSSSLAANLAATLSGQIHHKYEYSTTQQDHSILGENQLDLFDPNLLSSIGISPNLMTSAASSHAMDTEKPIKSKESHAKHDKGANSHSQHRNDPFEKQQHHSKEATKKQSSTVLSSHADSNVIVDEQTLLKQLESESNVHNIHVGGSKIVYRNEDSSYESSSSGISSGSSSEDEDAIKMDEES